MESGRDDRESEREMVYVCAAECMRVCVKKIEIEKERMFFYMCMCVCVFVRVRVFVRVCVCACVCACVCVYEYAYQVSAGPMQHLSTISASFKHVY